MENKKFTGLIFIDTEKAKEFEKAYKEFISNNYGGSGKIIAATFGK